MTDERRRSGQEGHPPDIDIDTSVAHPARVYNYLAGGDGHFSADREAVDQVATALPDGVDTARHAVQTMAAFLGRVVRYLASDVGVTQFLKVGTAVPTAKDVHEVAQEAAPDARVVYVGSDPVVLAHAHSLRRASPRGQTAYVHGDLGDPEAIVHQAGATLDLARPVAILLPATLNFVPDESGPYQIVSRLLAAVSAGSYLALAHASYDEKRKRVSEAAERFSKLLDEPYVVRSHAEIVRFFDGLDLVGPGVVHIAEWRPPGEVPEPQPGSDSEPPLVPLDGGVGRKPEGRP